MISLIKALILAVAFKLSLVSSALLSPPRFPEKCEGEAPTESPGLRLIPYRKNPMGPTRYIQCFAVGSSCKFDSDCPKPAEDQCTAQDKSGKSVIPASSICIKGFCRVKDALWNDSCDCLVGCNLFHDLNCVKGECVPRRCTPCGEKPTVIKCCPPGVKGHDGTCVCKSAGI